MEKNLAYLNSQEMQGSILSNLNNMCVRDGLEANYREYPQTLGKGSSYSPFSCTFPLTILPASGYRDILLYVCVINNTSVLIHVN